jgi:hypothetical protein
MTTDSDATRIVRSWLEEGVTVLPDRVLDAVLDQLPTTPQRRASWPVRRFPDMNNIAKVAIAAAAVVAAAVGINLFARGQENIGPVGPTVAPSTAATEPPTILNTDYNAPGTYNVGRWFPVQFNFTITDDWETWGATPYVVRIWKLCEPGACTGYSSILTFEIVTDTFADACHAVYREPPIGNGVDELVNELTSLPNFMAGPVSDVAVDGYAGRSFTLDKLASANVEGCVAGGDMLWVSDGEVSFGTGAHQQIIVLNVDGTRLLLDAIVYSGDGLEMDEIIDSIDFR